MISIERVPAAPAITAVAILEFCGGASGAVMGTTVGEVPEPNTSSFDEQVNDLNQKIQYEEHGIDQLEHARPDSQPAIDKAREIIGSQKGQVHALQEQKQHVIDEAHPHSGPYALQGAVIGMTAVALALGIHWGYRRFAGWREQRAR